MEHVGKYPKWCLVSQLDSLRFRLSLKTTEYHKADEERQQLKEQHAGLR